MELYRFTELSNELISYKWGIFMNNWRYLYQKKAHIFDILHEIGKLNSPKCFLKMPHVMARFFAFNEHYSLNIFKFWLSHLNSREKWLSLSTISYISKVCRIWVIINLIYLEHTFWSLSVLKDWTQLWLTLI